MLRTMLVAGTALLMGGCLGGGGGPAMFWNKPGFTFEQMSSDKLQCQQESITTSAANMGTPLSPSPFHLERDCMMRKGYHLSTIRPE